MCNKDDDDKLAQFFFKDIVLHDLTERKEIEPESVHLNVTNHKQSIINKVTPTGWYHSFPETFVMISWTLILGGIIVKKIISSETSLY